MSIQVKKTSPKAANEDLPRTSVFDKASKSVKSGKNCFFSQVKEKEKEIKEKIVHQDLVCEDEEFKPGKPVKYKNMLWVVKKIKANGDIEIEASYSRRAKMVNKKLLKIRGAIYEYLVSSLCDVALCVRKRQKRSHFHVVGCVFALQIWAMEHVLIGQKKLAKRKSCLPRILHWIHVKVGEAEVEKTFFCNESEADYGRKSLADIVAKNEALRAINGDQEASIVELEKLVEKLQMFAAQKRQRFADVGNCYSNKDYDMVVDAFGTTNSEEDYEVLLSFVGKSNSKKELQMQGDDVEKSNFEKVTNKGGETMCTHPKEDLEPIANSREALLLLVTK
ncbi:hypothetical protein LR48_Vigan681s000100 [Vigna angularis]|uniref:Uncharacterized protein n=1 Tax=Phaseolus angularis TaxID=3914 RepID=A0A0L9TFM2_PHAAN|nr:hypothetical protein LR48_Vigan681s000100 [Vigna angularis]